MRAVYVYPATGLIAQVLLVAALARSVGLGGAGWTVGVACAAIVAAALARGLSRRRSCALGPADWVTLARATGAVGVAALIADSFRRPAPIALLVTLTGVALALDAVDGWVARRSGTPSTFGARLDGEVDAFLILVLSVYVARSTGAWVLTIGAARYAFLAAGWLLPWLREPLPARYWRKVVAATQGIVLAVAAADVLPPALTAAALVAALALLGESFGRDVWWLWGRRRALSRHVEAVADRGSSLEAAAGAVSGRGRVRASLGVALTLLAIVILWGALVAPDHPGRLEPGTFARIPLEGIVALALALALPATARRVLAWVAGPALGLLVIVKLLDIGFFATFDRPFDPAGDWSYTGIAIETLRSATGRTTASLAVAGAVVLGVAVLLLMTLTALRLVAVAARRRRRSLQGTLALGVVWMVAWAFGAQLAPGVPIASTSAAALAIDKARAVHAGIGDRTILAEVARDRFRGTPGGRLLSGLRGKDVIVAFVESYGKVAVQGSSMSARVDAALDRGTERLRAAGFSSRSAFLVSPTFGGASWLAHATLQSGVWVDSQWRYDQLLATDRLTLSRAFGRAGWRTVGNVPANNRDWPPGTAFYRYDRFYDQRNLGYRGPRFAYAPMPDQYALAALRRLELARRVRRPVFAEVDLVSSHAPWTAIPELIGWDEVGNGAVFSRMPVDRMTKATLWSDPERLRAAYGRSIEYSLNTLVSFVLHYGGDDLVLVLLGDHQPSTIVTGQGSSSHPPASGPSHEVPISFVARDPAVLRQIAGWNWEQGLRPGPRAPVWPMSAFRDRFLAAFGSQPAVG